MKGIDCSRGTNITPDKESYETGLQKGLLYDHLKWLNKESAGLRKTGAQILKLVEPALLSLSLVGIPVAIKGAKILNRMNLYDAYFTEALKSLPSPDLIIEVKTDAQTFNHTNEYIIHNEFLFFRNRIDKNAWTPLYFDGFPYVTPIRIQADGANLIVIGKKIVDGKIDLRVHYKKVLKEELHILEIEAKKSYRHLSRKTCVMANATHKFKIQNDIVWVRGLTDDKKWRPLPYEGWPRIKPVKLELVEDNSGLKINDSYELDISTESLQKRLKGQEFPYDFHIDYSSAVMTNSLDNWKKRWFELPGFKYLNFSKEKRIKITENVIDVAISNRSGFAECWEDDAGVKHPNQISVTTLYVCVYDEKTSTYVILYADPWLPFEFHEHSLPFAGRKRLELPAGFIPEKLCASGSEILVYGKNANGEPALISRLADFDTEMINPHLHYAEKAKVKKKLAENKKIDPALRIRRDGFKELPPEELWTDIPLNGLDNEINLTTLTIFQTGKGNDAKELRIEDNAKTGIFWKLLSNKDADWEFKSYEELKHEEALIEDDLNEMLF